GSAVNAIQLDGFASSDAKAIGTKLNEIAKNAKTFGATDRIGSLYGFDLLVKSETSSKDGFDMIQNRFFARGEGQILYNYNRGVMAADPITASQNFIKALESMPKLLEKYQQDKEFTLRDVPSLKAVVAENWRKEPELKELKTELKKLEESIQKSIEPKEEETLFEEVKVEGKKMGGMRV
ncbi:MAG: DNA methylase, partial [Mangrovibacterium sp.]